jgi:subtilisin family serine protease
MVAPVRSAGALTTVLTLAIGAFLMPMGPAAHGLSAVQAGKVDVRVLADTEAGRTGSFLILLAERAKVDSAYGISDQSVRGRVVLDRLTSQAASSQRPLHSLLTSRGVPHRSYWAANMIAAEGGRDLVELLAARPDVRAIESNRAAPGVRAVEPPAVAKQPGPKSGRGTETVEWGVTNVRAPEVWALGHTGEGIVVASADTGVKWDHEAIVGQYRGWDGANADHNYNWHDAIHSAPPTNPCGFDSLVPCDDGGHGTHTTGTMVGDDGAVNQIGVAPGARWIGCRNMERGDGRPETYTECFQFFIAPTDLGGANPNPDLRPHVINNSWGCPPSELCAPLTLQEIVENTEAAGILVVASAGNGGSACSTVADPPGIYEAAFSIGAYDVNNVLAGFSSRGPVATDGSLRLKPNISGPGVAVRSSVIPGGYALFSGTSMSSPHVVGVVALLWSARPELSRDIPSTKQILQDTANPDVTIGPTAPPVCGGTAVDDIPNNHFGYGRVDAVAAASFVAAAPRAA